MKLTYFCRSLFLLAFLAACSGLFPAQTPTPTAISLTETPTATILWFPATVTPTLFLAPTILPTLEQRPGLGDLLFTDTFNQPALWNTSETAWATASVTRNRLILSISGQGPVSIVSLRSQPTLENFYAEAGVILSLCESRDQFGMLFRAAPGENYYRFVVGCDGRTRLERSLSGFTSPLLNWLPSGDAPIAAPADVKLGVWVVGDEMRFFLNDHFQFTVHDPVLHTGTLGFFAYANGSDPITVSFMDLSVYTVTYVSPTPMPIPSITPTSSQTPEPDN